MEERENFFAQDEDEGARLDKFLSEKVTRFSRQRLKECFGAGEVLVGGTEKKPSYKLSAGDLVSVLLPEDVKTDVLAQNIPLDILYEDDDIIVVNKPSGMVVHPSPGNYKDTLVNALLFHCEFLSAINGVFRPGIVHRIDKDTSGVLVVCKNDTSHRFLAKQFEDHSITREYRAVLHGTLQSKTFTIKGNIARDERDRVKMCVGASRGKRAVTHGKVMASSGDFSLVSFTLETGRTHQIRVHSAYISHPVVGDRTYGKKTPVDLRYAGQLLHAFRLGFIHPNGSSMEFSSPLPKAFWDFGFDEELLK